MQTQGNILSQERQGTQWAPLDGVILIECLPNLVSRIAWDLIVRTNVPPQVLRSTQVGSGRHRKHEATLCYVTYY